MIEAVESPANGRVPQQQRTRLRSKLWIAFLICCVLAGWLKAAQNRRSRQEFEAARIARDQKAAELYLLGEETAQRIADIRSNGLDGEKVISRQRLEQEINQGRPFSLEWDRKRGRHLTTWVDPHSGRVFRLYFRDQEWTGYSTSWGSDANLPPVPRPRAVYADDREQVRKLVVGYGPLFWALSLVLLLVLAALSGLLRLAGLPSYAEGLQPHCQFLADALLALAILCTLAYLVNPIYSITVSGVTSNDNLAWGTILLAISIPILAGVTPGAVRNPTQFNGRWQYSLRALLLVMTLCAVTFALAPFGYVVALFAVGGAALYAFVRVLTAKDRGLRRRKGPTCTSL